MKKQEKIDFVKDLEGKMKDAKSVVLVDFTGISVKSQQDLKKRLKEVGSFMVVVKNTLFKIAGQNLKLPEESFSDTILQGPTALIVSGEDPIAPLQVLAKFAKEFELPHFKVGVVEGAFQDKNALEKLSKLPGKEVLFGQVVGSISAPLYGIVGVMQANMQKLVFILQEAAKK